MKGKKHLYMNLTPFPNYQLKEYVGFGKIGIVYKAIRKNPVHYLACKIIPDGKLKKGWETEIEKVTLLDGVPNVVKYHSHKPDYDKKNNPITFVLYDFISGINLRQYIKEQPWPLTMEFASNIIETILKVLYACNDVEIEHGDLHEGNILIEDPDTRLPGAPRTIWITDFGYGGSHTDLTPKDDYRQLFAIGSTLLSKLKQSDMNSRDRILYNKIKNFLDKRLLESDATQSISAIDKSLLYSEFQELKLEAEMESAAADSGEEIKGAGDFLSGEALGYRVEDWKDLFVPDFLGAADLLNKNITVLTGARGCGKTMAFRRLTALMDQIIGEPSNV